MKDRSMKRPVGLAALAVAAALLSGCALGPRIVHTQVTSYDEWSALPADRTYAFTRTLEYQNSLELKSYEDIVGDELALQGFRRMPDPAAANLTVTLRPSVSGSRVRVRESWPVDPFWGRGFHGGGFYGGGFYGRGGWGGPGFGGFSPFWSYYGDYNDVAVDVFQRRLEVDIDSRATPGKRYYEGRVETSGPTDSMATAFPYLVRALFTDFPGNSGQTRHVDVPVAEAR